MDMLDSGIMRVEIPSDGWPIVLWMARKRRSMIESLRLKTDIPPGSADDPSLCWMFQAPPSMPYGIVLNPETGKQIGAHRASWIEAYGPIPDLDTYPFTMVVRHTCDTPGCVRPGHLRLGTPEGNARDARLRGRQRPGAGERHGLAVLSDAVVSEARTLYSSGWRILEIAERFGAKSPTIAQAIHGQTWTHVTDPPPVPIRPR